MSYGINWIIMKLPPTSPILGSNFLLSELTATSLFIEDAAAADYFLNKSQPQRYRQEHQHDSDRHLDPSHGDLLEQAGSDERAEEGR